MIRLLLSLVIQAAFIVLIAYVVFSFVPRPPDPLVPVVRGVRSVVDPMLAPIRRVLPPLRLGGVGIDLSIIVLFVLLSLLSGIV